MRFFVVEDSKVFASLIKGLLSGAGHEVRVEMDSRQALAGIVEFAPDCIILDIMMPEVDGMTLLAELRGDPAYNKTKIIIASAKPYGADRRRALELGADGYINKVAERGQLLERITELVEGSAIVTFWGVRGTLPVPGTDSIRYGGNTNCVSIEFNDGRLFIFDAGTGIKNLARHLLNVGRDAIKAKIFISHPHWDHINALPFFGPLYMSGNEFEILGPAQEKHSVADLISAQMDGVFFPVTVSEFAARVSYRNLGEGETMIDGLRVRTMLLSHPGQCLGFRVEYAGESVCYITDNELYPDSTEYFDAEYRTQLQEFMAGAEAVITDCTYMDDEYPAKIHWGHSAITQVVDLAHRAGVKTLYLFHHDPDQSDDDIDRKLVVAQQRLRELGSATRVLAPPEGYQFRLG